MAITRVHGLPRVGQIISLIPSLNPSFPGSNMFPISMDALIHHDCRRHLLHNILLHGLDLRFNREILPVPRILGKDVGAHYRWMMRLHHWNTYKIFNLFIDILLMRRSLCGLIPLVFWSTTYFVVPAVLTGYTIPLYHIEIHLYCTIRHPSISISSFYSYSLLWIHLRYCTCMVLLIVLKL